MARHNDREGMTLDEFYAHVALFNSTFGIKYKPALCNALVVEEAVETWKATIKNKPQEEIEDEWADLLYVTFGWFYLTVSTDNMPLSSFDLVFGSVLRTKTEGVYDVNRRLAYTARAAAAAFTAAEMRRSPLGPLQSLLTAVLSWALDAKIDYAQAMLRVALKNQKKIDNKASMKIGDNGKVLKPDDNFVPASTVQQLKEEFAGSWESGVLAAALKAATDKATIKATIKESTQHV